MSEVLWVGVAGLIFGILGAGVVIVTQGIGDVFYATSGASLHYNAMGAIIFSIIGMAGAVLEQRRVLGPLLMVIGAIGVVVSIFVMGVIASTLFTLGGVMISEQTDAR